MTLLRVLLLGSCFILFGHANAQDVDTILGKEPGLGKSKSKKMRIDHPVVSPTPALPTESLGLSIRLMGGAGMDTYSLSGTGFTTNLPPTLSTLYGGEIRYRPQNAVFSMFGRALLRKMKYTDLSGLTPSSVELTKTEMVGGLRFYLFNTAESSFWNSFSIGVGYSAMIHNATETQPDQVITDSTARGLMLVAMQEFSLGSNPCELAFEVHLPNSFQETGRNSGTFQSSTRYRLSGLFAIPLFSAVQLGLGFYASLSKNSFSGVGTRGTSNAQEQILDFGFPLQLKVDF